MANFQSNKSYGAAIHAKAAAEAGKYTPSDSSSDSTSISEGKTFLTAGLKDVYEPIDAYEGKQRWDVNFQWTEEEEKKVVRKVCLLWLRDTVLATDHVSDRLEDLHVVLLNILRLATRPRQYSASAE